MLISPSLQALVGFPTVRMDMAFQLDGVENKGLQGGRCSIRNTRHPDPSDPPAGLLGGNHDQRFAGTASSFAARGRAPDLGFIHLDAPAELIASGTHHRATQFMEHRPSGLVTAQPQDALQPEGAGLRLLTRHLPDQAKPHAQGLVRVLKNRARRRSNLVTTPRTQPTAVLQRPNFAPATMRTEDPLRPTQFRQLLTTWLFARKALLKVEQGFWVVFQPRATLPLGDGCVNRIARVPLFGFTRMESGGMDGVDKVDEMDGRKHIARH